MTSPFGPIQPLRAAHDVDDFNCGSDALTDWLRRRALQAQESDTCRVYVVCRAGTNRVVGYHDITAAQVQQDSAPARVKKGTASQQPIPVALLARLAVDVTVQGHQLGKALVVDALRRVNAAADILAVRALLIHCQDEAARRFYMHLADFDESPTDPLHLMLPIKDLRLLLKG
jgi:GNAT superfamily N-acetyltransferase